MRNALLMIATFGVLALGYFYYSSATRIEHKSRFDRQANLSELADDAASEDNTVVIDLRDDREMQLPPGKETSFTVFNEFTGRPVQQFSWATWEKVSGTRNDVAVTEPELRLFTQQLVVVVSAERGQLAVDEVDRRRFRPKKGWLEGEVRIRVERDPDGDETRAAVALDGIAIDLERMHFDLELGQLQAEGELAVRGPAFTLEGTGLRLVWNDVDRRIDTLEIRNGKRLTLNLQSGLFDQVRAEPGEHAPPPSVVAQPKAGPKTATERVMTYAVALLDDVAAVHYRGEHEVGRLTADELHLLFDIAGNSNRVFENESNTEAAAAAETPAAPASQPVAAATTQPAEAAPDEPRRSERLVVNWSGPLRLAPQLSNRARGDLRRHIEARGELVRIEGRGSTIECGQLHYREEERRLWLHPRGDRPVMLRTTKGPSVDADSIFFDRDAGIVKLVGNVRVRGLAPNNARDQLGIRCRMWAELHLGGEDETAPAMADPTGGIDLSDVGLLERAVFVGGVRADLDGGRALQAHRLETRFAEVPVPATSQPVVAALAAQPLLIASQPIRPEMLVQAAPDELAGDLQLTDAFASGNVRLSDGDQVLRGAWMKINFDTAADGRTWPTELVARGDIGIRNSSDGVYARGRLLTAQLSPDGRLTDAAIVGAAGHPAVALAQTYRISGARINVALAEKTGPAQPFHIRVPGWSELVFVSDRGLGGQQRGRAGKVRITASQALEFDSDATRNQVRFVGDVVAAEGGQRLDADTLTLYLRDIATTTRPTGFARLRSLVDTLLGGREDDGMLAGTGGMRKEPLRLVAQHAALTSEERVAGRPRPVVTQYISAPELTVEIPQRTVRTVGQTMLGMTSLRLPSGQDSRPSGGEALGLPSAMISGGPSQTALMAKSSMTYVFGEEGSGRGDSVLFDGGVIFRHVLGSEMARFAELLPEVAGDPAQVAQLKSRNTYLACDRLELLLGQAESAQVPGQGMTLTWLNARGNVHLKDQQGAGIRTVEATQIEFDRNAKTVRVLGDPARNAPARVEYMNRETNRFEQPAVGPAFTIYLDSNTVKAEKVSGSIQR